MLLENKPSSDFLVIRVQEKSFPAGKLFHKCLLEDYPHVPGTDTDHYHIDQTSHQELLCCIRAL